MMLAQPRQLKKRYPCLTKKKAFKNYSNVLEISKYKFRDLKFNGQPSYHIYESGTKRRPLPLARALNKATRTESKFVMILLLANFMIFPITGR